MFSNQITPILPHGFVCKKCNFISSNKKDYTRHIQTKKHIINLNQPFLPIFTPKNPFACTCGKTYKDKSGLWRHKKKCIEDSESVSYSVTESVAHSEDNQLSTDKDLIMMLIKQNTELLEIVKNGTHNTSNSHNNSHNKSFNLQFFLNETCKNAMNITDFVDSLQLQLSDLENVGEAGYIEGISSIIINKLNTLDVTERPIHCTDKKRETMYVKDENKWEKEDEKKTKMHKMVSKVANKNINMISEFQKVHPEWKKCSSKYADQHNKIVIESMGGKGDNEYEKQEKIIKKIAKEVFVNKDP